VVPKLTISVDGVDVVTLQAIPVLVLATASNSMGRMLPVVVNVAVQLGIQMLFRLPTFAAISIIASLPLLPTPLLDRHFGKPSHAVSGDYPLTVNLRLPNWFPRREKDGSFASACRSNSRRGSSLSRGTGLWGRYLPGFFFV
jgi:hypothetical protein